MFDQIADGMQTMSILMLIVARALVGLAQQISYRASIQKLSDHNLHTCFCMNPSELDLLGELGDRGEAAFWGDTGGCKKANPQTKQHRDRACTGQVDCKIESNHSKSYHCTFLLDLRSLALIV